MIKPFLVDKGCKVCGGTLDLDVDLDVEIDLDLVKDLDLDPVIDLDL